MTIRDNLYEAQVGPIGLVRLDNGGGIVEEVEDPATMCASPRAHTCPA